MNFQLSFQIIEEKKNFKLLPHSIHNVPIEIYTTHQLLLDNNPLLGKKIMDKIYKVHKVYIKSTKSTKSTKSIKSTNHPNWGLGESACDQVQCPSLCPVQREQDKCLKLEPTINNITCTTID